MKRKTARRKPREWWVVFTKITPVGFAHKTKKSAMQHSRHSDLIVRVGEILPKTKRTQTTEKYNAEEARLHRAPWPYGLIVD